MWCGYDVCRAEGWLGCGRGEWRREKGERGKRPLYVDNSASQEEEHRRGQVGNGSVKERLVEEKSSIWRANGCFTNAGAKF